jgi:hypothetical protein
VQQGRLGEAGIGQAFRYDGAGLDGVDSAHGVGRQADPPPAEPGEGFVATHDRDTQHQRVGPKLIIDHAYHVVHADTAHEVDHALPVATSAVDDESGSFVDRVTRGVSHDSGGVGEAGFQPLEQDVPHY